MYDVVRAGANHHREEKDLVVERVLGCEPLGAPPPWPASPGSQSGACGPPNARQLSERLRVPSLVAGNPE